MVPLAMVVVVVVADVVVVQSAEVAVAVAEIIDCCCQHCWDHLWRTMRHCGILACTAYQLEAGPMKAMRHDHLMVKLFD